MNNFDNNISVQAASYRGIDTKYEENKAEIVGNNHVKQYHSDKVQTSKL